VKCVAGTFSNEIGATTCGRCPPGLVTTGEGSTSCTNCTEGQYVLASGSGCVNCASGQIPNPEFTSCIDSYLLEEDVKRALWGLGAIGLGFVVAGALTLIFGRHNRIIVYSQIPFMWVALLGFALAFTAQILWAADPTKELCMARHWIINLGACFLAAALLMKTWRVHKWFNSSVLTKVNISDSSLFLKIAFILSIDVIILGIWNIVSPFKMDALTHHCSSDAEPYVHIFLWGYQFLLVILLAILAYQIRNVNMDFNESAWLSRGLQNMLVAALTLIILSLSLQEVQSPRDWVVMMDFILWYVALTTFCFLFVPKWVMMCTAKSETHARLGDKLASNTEDAEKDAMELEETEKKNNQIKDYGDAEYRNLKLNQAGNVKVLTAEHAKVEELKKELSNHVDKLNAASQAVVATRQEIFYRKQILVKEGKITEAAAFTH